MKKHAQRYWNFILILCRLDGSGACAGVVPLPASKGVYTVDGPEQVHKVDEPA